MNVHPSDPELFDFAKGVLPDFQFESIASHLEHCDRCADILRRTGAFQPICRPDPSEAAEDEPSIDLDCYEGTHVGPYKLLEKIGEGGMGTVFHAEQKKPVRRMVAVKIIKPGLDTRNVVARFEAERQALAMMEHNNIARVFDAGTTVLGRPYFVMELVKGIPITQYCDENRLTTHERLELFVPVCQAIQHAHQKGVIHRDIKPTNVLVALYDGQPIPKIIDFGIAKATQQKLTERTMYTSIGQVLGTLEYMSPEQAEVNQLDVDTRSDVYSLGALLYELLTGTTPFPKKQLEEFGYEEMLKTIREREPPIPSTRISESHDNLPMISTVRRTDPAKLSKLVRGELDWIVMKALEKDRTRRYESASDLAKDVQNFLAGQDVTACPPSAWYKLRKLARRNQSLLATLACVVALLVVATATSTWFAWQASLANRLSLERLHEVQRERDEKEKALDAAVIARHAAEKSSAIAEVNLNLAQRSAYAADLNIAHTTLLHTNDVDRIMNLLNRHRPKGNQPDLRGWEWRYLWQFCQSEAQSVLTEFGEAVNSLELSPDGKRLAIGLREGRLEIWDIATKAKTLERDGLQRNHRLKFSPDGKHLAVGLPDGAVELLESTNLTAAARFETNSAFVGDVAFSPDGRLLVASCRQETFVWDLHARKTITQIPIHLSHRLSGEVCFSPDSQHLYLGTRGHLHAIDVERLDAVENQFARGTSFSLPMEVSAMAVSPNGRTLAFANYTEPRTISLVDAISGEPQGKLLGHAGWIEKLMFGQSGCLYSASIDNTIRVWDIDKRESLRVLRSGCQNFCLAEVAPNQLLSSGAGGVVLQWNTGASHQNRSEKARRVFAGSLALHPRSPPDIGPDERRIVYATPAVARAQKVSDFKNGVAVLDLTSGQRVPIDTLADDEFYGTVRFLDDERIAVGTLAGKVKIVNVQTDQVEHEWNAHAAQKRVLSKHWIAEVFTRVHHILPKKNLLVSERMFIDQEEQNEVPSRTEVKFWNLDGWHTSNELQAPDVDRPFDRCWFSPDRSLCAVAYYASSSGAICSTQTGKVLHELPDANCVAFCPTDPDLMVVVSGSGAATLLDTRTFQVRSQFKTHSSRPSDATFFPDGQRFVTGANGDEMLRIWDLSTRRMLMNLEGDGYRVGIRISDRGNVILLREQSGKIIVWTAPSWDDIRREERKGSKQIYVRRDQSA